MSLVYIGEQDFITQSLPSYSKNEFGVDVMTIRYKGPAFALDGFLSTLTQGDVSADDSRFYVQSWSVDDNPVYPTVTLSCKGLIDGIPTEMASDDTSMQSLTVTTDTPSNASLEMQFWATQTTYNYITDARPTGPTYDETSNSIDPVVVSRTYRDADGNLIYGSVSLAIASALEPSIIDLVTGYSASPIYGTPYFECTDNVIRTYETQ